MYTNISITIPSVNETNKQTIIVVQAMKINLLFHCITSLLCFAEQSTPISTRTSSTSSTSVGRGKVTKYYHEFERTELPSSLHGKVVVITGCTPGGMGLVAAQCAARKDAQSIVLLNRLSDRATAAEVLVKEQISVRDDTGITTPSNVETIPCDLQDFSSVNKAIQMIQSRYNSIDVLCNNAGVMALDDIVTVDGYDIQMQINHLSHFLLTKELFPLLQNSAFGGRIINHSSLARNGTPIQAKYLEKQYNKNLGGNDGTLFSGPKFERYHQTKLANSCFTAALARKIKTSNNPKNKNLKALCAAPGFAQTNLFGNNNNIPDLTNNPIGNMLLSFVPGQSAEDGAMSLITAMFGTKVRNGDFYEPRSLGGIYGKVHKVSYDKNSINIEQQQLLWEKSEQACGKFII